MTLCHNVSLGNLIPAELAKALRRDAWRDYRLMLPLLSYLNEKLHGMPNEGEMAHGFYWLVVPSAKTRPPSTETFIGDGTVANENPANGTSCLVEGSGPF